MKIAAVRDISEQIRGVTYAKSDASATPKSGYSPMLRAINIGEYGLLLEDLIFVPNSKISPKQRIVSNDVVVATSSGSISVVGKTAQARLGFDGGFGAFCKVLRPGPDVDPHYFGHYFKTPSYRRVVSQLASGANINNLRKEHLDNLPIPSRRSPSRSGLRRFWMRRTPCGPSAARPSPSLTPSSNPPSSTCSATPLLIRWGGRAHPSLRCSGAPGCSLTEIG